MPVSGRVFVDANVLFSASYQAHHPFLLFWTSKKVQVVVSACVVDEVRRNISDRPHLDRLNQLLARTELAAGSGESLPRQIVLPAKDLPIFTGAILARAPYLVTGDKRHFGRYFDQTFETASGPLTVIEPASLLRRLKKPE